MKVKDCLALAAAQLGLEKGVQDALNNGETENEDVALLLRCFNVVENELALDYLPLYQEDEVLAPIGIVDFSALEKQPVRVISVKDAHGEAVAFTLFPKYLKAQAGNLSVAYTYAPSEKGLESESEYTLYASTRLFAYGIAAEYCLHKAAYDEAAVWDRKYKDAIEAAYKVRPCRRIRSRSWT